MNARILTPLALLLVIVGFLTMGAGCSSDPNVEGGKIEMQKKDYAKALELFEKGVTANPSNPEAWKYKAMALVELAKASNDPLKRADRYAALSEAVAKIKTLAPAMAGDAGRLALQAWANEINDGVNAFNSQAAGMPEKANAHFKNATVVLPDSTYGFELLGRSFYKLEKYPEAAVPFEKVIASGKVKDETTFLLLGNIYLFLMPDKATDALRVLEAGSARYPNNETMKTMLTDAYRKSGQAERALANYKARMESNPTDADNMLRYGNLLNQLERYDEAIPVLAKAYELKNDSEDIVYNYGISLFNKAVFVNKQMNELPSNDLANYNRLKDVRDGYFRKAAPLLEEVYQLYSSSKREVKPICGSLFSIFTQLKDTAKSQSYMSCAGFDKN